MKIQRQQHSAAFGLVDATFAMAIAGVLFTALYAGLSFGFKTIKFARENTRATQIMLERMEVIRLYRWDQVNTAGWVPTNFVEPYYSMGGTNSSLMYTGRIALASSSLGTSYENNVKKVTIQLSWVTDKTARSRTMSTYISKNGMQSYVF